MTHENETGNRDYTFQGMTFAHMGGGVRLRRLRRCGQAV